MILKSLERLSLETLCKIGYTFLRGNSPITQHIDRYLICTASPYAYFVGVRREPFPPFTPGVSMPENWQACIDAYLQSIYDISGSEQSRETYRSNLTRFFKHCNKSPDDVSRSDVLAFIQSPSTARCNPGGQASAATKNQRLCVLRSFYTFASSYELDGALLYQKVMPTQGMRYLKPDA